jgi:hypothetical protein
MDAEFVALVFPELEYDAVLTCDPSSRWLRVPALQSISAV